MTPVPFGRLGVVPVGERTVEARVWAPAAAQVAVRIGRRIHRLARERAGLHAGRIPGTAGDDYRFVLDGRDELADPCSRFQPGGVEGPSRVVDPAFPWTDDGFALDPSGLVLYELHVGAFTGEGTFDAVVPRLARLRRLGVRAIELMPVGTFPGRRGWGYDSIFASAPHPVYGGPDGLRRLVDAAHAEGVGVILDVVYNHLGPGAEAFARLGPWFAPRAAPWGPRPRFGERAVREWAIQNALMWAREFHVDGLRVDAVWEIRDRSRTHLVKELVERLEAEAGRSVAVTLEGDPADRRVRGDRLAWGATAWWADGFHHALHAVLTGERDGYYRGLGSVGDLAAAFRRAAEAPLVVCAQNHDQVGNRPLGDRLSGARALLAAACVAFSPFVPLVFMGEERGETRPFLFFSDHHDPGVAEATRRGRAEAFRAFSGFADEAPDPQARSTFDRSRLAPAGDTDIERLFARLYAVRRSLPAGPVVTAHDDTARWLRVDRGHRSLCASFSDAGAVVPLPTPGSRADLLLATGQAAAAGHGVRVGGWSAAIVAR